MNLVDMLDIEMGKAICYSGFRKGQSPSFNQFPSFEEIKEDILLLAKEWKYIRVYDAGEHARSVLEVIKNEKLNIKVMIGTCLNAEISNNECPWGIVYTNEQLRLNKIYNLNEMNNIINLANQYPDIVFAVSAGNEATAEWTDHLVSIESIIEYVKLLKENIKQPVTFCENYLPWQNKLDDLVAVVDFISLHTYPVWEYKTIDEALGYTIDNYYSVKNRYPDKAIIITEAGWATNSNGRGIPTDAVNQDFQKKYYEEILKWSCESKIMTFIFEAFDEDWKGSADPMEPEKHWGVFTIDRKPKLVISEKF
jgi:exo-beta-1,3-glucanase (GH17 family)